MVQEHIREVRDSLPRGYYRELPELASGALAGYPRVYEIAITLISHTEARIELENVDLFLDAFQEVRPLVIGELWAIPAMLRLGLIESVRRMALRTVRRLEELEAADGWATRLVEAGDESAAAVAEALTDFISDPPLLTPTFVSRFLGQLRGAGGGRPELLRLEHWIAEHGMPAEEASGRATERVALTQLTMANSITSLRGIARMDWEAFVERQSAMEATLRQDPAGVYRRMMFATRDQYRHVVERIARRSRRDEATVARDALELAQAAPSNGTGEADRRRHVGYYLVDEGLPELERVTGYRPPAGLRLYRWALRHPNVVFVGGVLAGTLAAILAVLWLGGPEARAAWPVVLLFAFIPANDIAVTAMNQLLTAFLPPHRLPKLDLGRHGGVPEEFRTVVVVPTLFGSVDAVREALEHLEVQYLANREDHLQFAILSDFTDAPTETRETDEAILAAAVSGIQRLNAEYGDDEDAFYLFHRSRRWNPRQGVWMGWERKRGKLAEFNRFLRGGDAGAFSRIVGDPAPLQRVRYVITLDADTVLPPETAALLIGALAHPLNRAEYDEGRGRVVRGYGILQPRVGVALPSAHRSQFAAIHSGHPGVDPYTTAVSDVYQDLYGEGSFTGKGIYDVDAFERATHGRFPENTLLSHDLIEGNYARAGLASDIVVYDDYPARYLTFTRRKHRWIRGDWQLLRWLTNRVPGPDGPEPNRLSLLSRWKILDNLRRSTVELAQLAFLIAGWTVLPGDPLRWTLLGLGAIAAPHLVALLLAILRPPMDKSWRAYYAAVGHDAATSLQQLALAIAFLPHQAWVSADAILRTLWRLAVTRRQLLEWQTASQTERLVGGGPGAAWRTMWPAVALPLVLLGLAMAGEALGSDDAVDLAPLIGAALPLLLLWSVSPAIAYAISAPAVRRERRLPASSRTAAMRYALLHWRFFDRFVTQETHWLAPDNYQEDPAPVVAMRTSPTNIGLQLLSTVSAHDLGFITTEDMTQRLERAFDALAAMRRFRGHWYNWYDLRDLQVLEPAYVSTVDSGNLAGHFIALRQACLGVADEPVFDARTWRALRTGVLLAQERVRQAFTPPRHRAGAVARTGAGRRGAAPGGVGAGRARRAAAGRDAGRDHARAGTGSRIAGRAARAAGGAGAGGRMGRLVPHAAGAAGGSAGGPEAPAGLGPRVAADRPLGVLEGRGDPLPRGGRPAGPPGPAGGSGRGLRRSDGLRLPLRPDPEPVRHRLPGGLAHARRLVLRSPGLRGPAGELPGGGQERGAGRALVPAGPDPDPRGGGHRAGVVEREHVRVPHAQPGHALVPLHRARRHLRGRRAPAGGLRHGAGRALGHQRERLQPARPLPHLPVPRLRRARPGPQARSRPGPGRGALRVGAGGDDHAAAGDRQPRRAGEARRARPLRLPRGARLHPPRSGPALRPGAGVHGASRRHEPGRPHQRAHGPGVAAPLPRRLDGALGRAAAARAGAPAARAAGAAGQPGRRGVARPRARAARGARGGDPRYARAPRRPAGPPAVHGDGQPLRLGLQPVRGAGRDPLAGRRHARSHRPVLLRARPEQREGLVRRSSAGLRAGRPLPRLPRHRPGDHPADRRR